MNFLAHSYLSGNEEEILVGNMVGDYVKGTIENSKYPENIKKGIALHREIDAFTDSNPHHIKSKNRLNKKFRLYRSAMTDIFYDHFLAKHWDKYSDTKLIEYSKNIYSILENYTYLFPGRFNEVLFSMKKSNWLYNYKEVDFIDRVLKGISHYRIKRSNIVKEGVIELKSNYDELEEDFLYFFEEIKEYFNM